jgi:hypothetical protein
MIIDRPESWYIFIFSKDYFDSPSDPGSYILYNGKRLTNKEYLDHWGKWVFFEEKKNFMIWHNSLTPMLKSIRSLA